MQFSFPSIISLQPWAKQIYNNDKLFLVFTRISIFKDLHNHLKVINKIEPKEWKDIQELVIYFLIDFNSKHDVLKQAVLFPWILTFKLFCTFSFFFKFTFIFESITYILLPFSHWCPLLPLGLPPPSRLFFRSQSIFFFIAEQKMY